MCGGRQVLDPVDIRRPRHVSGILRPPNGKVRLGQRTRRRKQELVDDRLPVGAVGAEVAEQPALVELERRVGGGVDEAVERLDEARVPEVADTTEQWSSGEREVEVVAADELR